MDMLRLGPHSTALRYREDIELAHKVGSTTFRFSFEWGRLEPVRGKFDPAAIKRY